MALLMLLLLRDKFRLSKQMTTEDPLENPTIQCSNSQNHHPHPKPTNPYIPRNWASQFIMNISWMMNILQLLRRWWWWCGWHGFPNIKPTRTWFLAVAWPTTNVEATEGNSKMLNLKGRLPHWLTGVDFECGNGGVVEIKSRGLGRRTTDSGESFCRLCSNFLVFEYKSTNERFLW